MANPESAVRSPAALPGGPFPRQGRLPPLNSGVVSAAIVDLLILSICTLSVFSYFFLC